MRRVQLLTVFCAGLVVASCGESQPGANSAVNSTPPAIKPPIASSLPPSPDPADAALVATGPIIVEHQMDMTAQKDGIIDKIFFDAPARVKTGVLLAQFDGRQTTVNLEAAKAKTRSIAADLKNWQAETEVLKADYVRAQRLFDLGLTTQEQLQHAKFKVDSDQFDILRVTELLNNAREEEHSLELEIEKTKVIAPFDGVIARRYIREGQNVAKGDRLFWVTAEAPLLMRFTLPEKFFGKLRNSLQVEVTCSNAPAEKHLARVKEVSPVIDPTSGTFEVLVELMGDRGSLRPGMTASARIDNLR